MTVRRPSDLFVEPLLAEYRRLAAMREPPITMRADPEDGRTNFKCSPNVESFYFRYCSGGQDYAGLLAWVAWLKNGPKIADVTEEQFQALSQVEVRLEVKDVRLPFPSLLVNMPAGKMHQCVILLQHEAEDVGGGKLPVIIGASISHDNLHDIVTVVRQQTGQEVEASLGRFYGDVTQDEATHAHASLRVALNMALAMTNYGCQASYLFPAEVAAEKKFILKGDRRSGSGRTASERLHEQPILVTIERGVELYHREGGRSDCEPTGREATFHWRRGHWRKARVGVGRAETRLVFVRPCMVRADLLQGTDPMDTVATYHK